MGGSEEEVKADSSFQLRQLGKCWCHPLVPDKFRKEGRPRIRCLWDKVARRHIEVQTWIPEEKFGLKIEVSGSIHFIP